MQFYCESKTIKADEYFNGMCPVKHVLNAKAMWGDREAFALLKKAFDTCLYVPPYARPLRFGCPGVYRAPHVVHVWVARRSRVSHSRVANVYGMVHGRCLWGITVWGHARVRDCIARASSVWGLLLMSLALTAGIGAHAWLVFLRAASMHTGDASHALVERLSEERLSQAEMFAQNNPTTECFCFDEETVCADTNWVT